MIIGIIRTVSFVLTAIGITNLYLLCTLGIGYMVLHVIDQPRSVENMCAMALIAMCAASGCRAAYRVVNENV